MNSKNDDSRTELVESVRALTLALDDWVGDFSEIEWKRKDGFLTVIWRSILLRQFDSLKISADLVSTNHGYASVSLLRPSCEELLWLRYLECLSKHDANELLDHMTNKGILRDLEAQAGKNHKLAAEDGGLARILNRYRADDRESKEKLKALAIKLNWPKRTIKEGGMPSVWYIAQHTGSDNLYRYLYHATSRYVHFSPVELARRGWGENGVLKISSQSYEPLWAIFALSWGARIFGLSLGATLGFLREEGIVEPPHEEITSAFSRINKIPVPPLITEEELITPAGHF